MNDLAQAAVGAREFAYAPYSGYRVGSALRDEKGLVHIGCNVEYVTYGLTLCAERSAIARMAVLGSRRIDEIAVATVDGAPPCGMCLQALLEFCDDPTSLLIHCADEAGELRTVSLADLLPHGFRSAAVRTS